MEYLFLLHGLVALVVCLLVAFNFFRHYKKEDIKKIVHWFAFIFFVYGFLAVVSFSWFFNYAAYDPLDFIFIYALAVLVQTVVLFGSFYLLYGRKKIFNWLYFYLVPLISVYISFSYLPVVMLVTSFFLTLVLFLNLYSVSFIFKKVSYAGIIYAGVSVLFQFLVFFNVGDVYSFALISSFMFLVFVYMFLRDIQKYPLKVHKHIKFVSEKGVILFMKYFIFMIVVVNLVLVSTISFHEFSHVAVSRYFGCESRTIAYEGGSYPYSEIVCDDLEHKVPITLAGPLGPILIALLLIFIGGRYMRPIAFLVVGFNLLAGYRDFGELGLSPTIILSISMVGLVFLFFGVVLLARARMQDHRDFAL